MGSVSRARIEEAVHDAELLSVSPEQLLVDQGVITADQMSRALAERFGLDHLDLSRFQVDMAAANMIALPWRSASRWCRSASSTTRTLLVALENPSNVVAIDDLALSTGMTIKVGRRLARGHRARDRANEPPRQCDRRRRR